MGSITALIIALLLLCSDNAIAQSKKEYTLLSSLGKEKIKTEKEKPPQEEEPLDFSDTGRPGQQTAGESRGGCLNLDNKVEAIVPASHSGKTVSSHPTFWVYFPYNSQQISHVEFIIQNEAREDIWRSQFKSNKNTGYQSFSLPKTESPLEIGQWYRWYVKIYCQPHTASTQYVQSWVKRISLTSRLYLEIQQESPSLHTIYGEYGIWYDAIDGLLKEYQLHPSSLTLEQDWQNLIEARGVELQSLPDVEAIYEAVK